MRYTLLASLILAGCVTTPAASPPDSVVAAAIPLKERDSSQQRIGQLRYLGGVHLTSPDAGFGGLSSLKWHDGRLHAVIDEGGWASFRPVERSGRLIGIKGYASGRLHGPDGLPLAGKPSTDAESLAREDDHWLVSFERNHRISRYADLNGPAAVGSYDPVAIFGALGNNEGIEAMASRAGRLFVCAERQPGLEANCAILARDGSIARVALAPPAGLDPRVGFPTDADFGADGTAYVLFRSWSGGSDNRGAVVAVAPGGGTRTLATFIAPISVDNLEGLAIREEGGRTYFYILSDDNFSRRDNPSTPETWQRTLLMKFELIR